MTDTDCIISVKKTNACVVAAAAVVFRTMLHMVRFTLAIAILIISFSRRERNGACRATAYDYFILLHDKCLARENSRSSLIQLHVHFWPLWTSDSYLQTKIQVATDNFSNNFTYKLFSNTNYDSFYVFQVKLSKEKRRRQC